MASHDSSDEEVPIVVNRGPDHLCAQEKVAVVFGVDDYARDEMKLTCGKSDAQALHAKFHAAGFFVVIATDVTSNQFWVTIEYAAKKISVDTKVVVFHFSGHGQHDNGTWLIPTDEVKIDLQAALRTLLRPSLPSVTTLVILDCCRNSPSNASSTCITYEGSNEKENQEVAHWKEKCRKMYEEEEWEQQGQCPRRRKFIFFFACGLGEPAREFKSGGHGALTRAVLKHLFEEIDLRDIVDKINESVQTCTRRLQRSWTSSNFERVIGNPILFKTCCFKVAKAADKRFRAQQKCEDEQRELAEGYSRENQMLKQKLSVADFHGGVPQWPQSPSLPASRRQSSISRSLEPSLRKPWIAIDGNIGVGKTRSLTDVFVFEVDARVEPIIEPVSQWAEGPLKTIYNLSSSPTEVCLAQLDIMQHFLDVAEKYDAVAKDPKIPGLISERSPLSVVKIFCQNFLDEGRITADHFDAFRKFYSRLLKRDCVPTHYVLLEATVATCQKRIKKRGRPEEQAMPVEYLHKIKSLLDRVYAEVERGGGTVIRINVEEDNGKDAIAQFVKEVGFAWSNYIG